MRNEAGHYSALDDQSSSLTERDTNTRRRRENPYYRNAPKCKKDSHGVSLHLPYYILNVGAIMKCVALGSRLAETLSVYKVKI